MKLLYKGREVIGKDIKCISYNDKGVANDER